MDAETALPLKFACWLGKGNGGPGALFWDVSFTGHSQSDIVPNKVEWMGRQVGRLLTSG